MTSNNTNKALTGYPSFFLDLARIIATLIVYFVHCRFILKDNLSYFKLQGQLAHGAVIVFFVLSGYVIANSVSNKSSLPQYLITRISKLTSVYLPAIVCTSIIIFIIYLINKPHYQYYKSTFEAFRVIASLFYLQEIWFFSLAPKFNGPLWSLGYEFWFYIIFGLYTFNKKGEKKGLLVLFATCFFVGPKILIMMGIWLMGVLAYKLPPQKKIKNLLSAYLSVAFLFAALVLSCYLPSLPYSLVSKPLNWASQFITDWIVGFVVAVSFWLIPNVAITLKALPIILRKIGNLTFPIYALHFPLLILAKSIFDNATNYSIYFGLIVLTILAICVLFGLLCNQTSYFWKNKLTSFVQYIQLRTKNSFPSKN